MQHTNTEIGVNLNLLMFVIGLNRGIDCFKVMETISSWRSSKIYKHNLSFKIYTLTKQNSIQKHYSCFMIYICIQQIHNRLTNWKLYLVFLIQYNKENTRNYRWITCIKNVTRDTTQYQVLTRHGPILNLTGRILM